MERQHFLRGAQEQRRLAIARSLSGDSVDALDAKDFIPPDVVSRTLLRQETQDAVPSQVSVLQQVPPSREERQVS
jgi:hypothetical protein